MLPSTILDICHKVLTKSPNDVFKLIAFLAWVSLDKAKEYMAMIESSTEEVSEKDAEKEKWKNNVLYKKNTKTQLQARCKQLKIPVISTSAKHDMVKLLSMHESDNVQPSKLWCTEENCLRFQNICLVFHRKNKGHFEVS